MWKLYDDLYIGIPSGIVIEGCFVGEKWTTVRANGNIGIARTFEMPENPEKFAAGYMGAYLRDSAGYLKWDSLARAGVGVAALNAWYNTAERAAGLEGDKPAAELAGKVAHVGDYAGENVFPLPMSGAFDESAYAALKSYDTVVISADALVTRALPKLLDIVGETGNAVLEGYSLPCTALFFAFGMPVREIRGYYTRYADTIESCAMKGKPPAPSPGMLPFCVRPLKVKKIV